MTAKAERAEAKALGLPTYFTGKPCSKGHISPRCTANGSCMQCVNEAKQRKRSKRPGYRTRAEITADMNGPTRICSACKQSFPNTEEFFIQLRITRPNESVSIYPARECRPCRNARYPIWYADDNNRDIVIARATAGTKARRTTPEGREQSRIWALSGYHRRMRDPHKRKRRQKMQRKYNQANPDLFRASRALRRARKLGALGKCTTKQFQQILQKQKHRCFFCNTDLIKTGYHLEHLIPLARGGSNWPSNIAASCPTCNLNKNDKTPKEFSEWKNWIATLAISSAPSRRRRCEN